MFLSGREQASLRRCFALLAEDAQERQLRERLGAELLQLLRADHFASYVWDAGCRRFLHRTMLNMSADNLDRYEAWFMFRDPITFELQARRHATAVSEVLPHRELVRTEFFNDFLARDGLHWGLNLHAFDGGQALGDLRIWRSRRRREFEPRDKQLLDLLEPAFVAALRRARRQCTVAGAPAGPVAALSRRERDVARCVCRGLTDKEIARELAIGLPSVRTYLQRIFDKLGVHRRAGLAQLARQFDLQP
ncbi:MAG: helix-turn-helix transcriptional regulator [Pseudomonadota bacterium]